jgi:hypothetical protein
VKRDDINEGKEKQMFKNVKVKHQEKNRLYTVKHMNVDQQEDLEALALLNNTPVGKNYDLKELQECSDSVKTEPDKIKQFQIEHRLSVMSDMNIQDNRKSERSSVSKGKVKFIKVQQGTPTNNYPSR